MAVSENHDFPHGRTPAAEMLTDAIHRAAHEYGMSLREAGRQLGYKQAVVLSHMATGRVPIPVDRAFDIADVLRLPKIEFLRAVLTQRHPDLPWNEIISAEKPPPGSPAEFVWSLEQAAGKPISELNGNQLRVMREVAATPDADRRWLSVHEVPVIEMLRRVRPTLASEGLDQADTHGIEALLA